MLSYYGQQADIETMKSVTVDEIHKKYKELAYGKNTEIKTTTILPLTDSNGCTLREAVPKSEDIAEENMPIGEPLYDVFFFFDVREGPAKPVEKPTPKVVM